MEIFFNTCIYFHILIDKDNMHGWKSFLNLHSTLSVFQAFYSTSGLDHKLQNKSVIFYNQAVIKG